MPTPTDAYAPTLVGVDDLSAPSPASEPGPSTSTRQPVHVGFRPRFEDETASLLRQRLSAAAVAIVSAFAFTFSLNLTAAVPVPVPELRASLLAVAALCLILLRSPLPLSLRQLRLIELATFGAAAAAMLAVEAAFVIRGARDGDYVAVTAGKRNLMASFTGLILVYGLFVPNGWKRAAAVLSITAALPFALQYALARIDPEVAAGFAADRVVPNMPGPLLAAGIAIYGTHVIQAIRREAFKARRFGQYVLGDRIGGGGMGEVFKAEHRLLKRPCAIKLIRPGSEADARAIAHFEREVRATARLSHVNTVEVYDYGRTDDGAFYYVMEHLRGLSFEDLVRRHGPLPPARAIHLLRQACGALAEAHAAGLVHRDLKPANLFAAERGGVHDFTKLLDFGLARQSGDLPARPGSVSGTPLYMAPEQAADFGRADARADLYALGAVAYFLLTAQPPFRRDSLTEVLQAHATEPPPLPSRLRPDIPPDLEAVILRCLAKPPESRFPDAPALESALAACAAADRWTPNDAAEWWQARHTPPPGRRPTPDDTATTTIPAP